MRALALTCVLVLGGWACVALGNTVESEGEATGQAVLWFLGDDVTAEFEGDVAFSGQLTLEDRVIGFTVTGTATGNGSGKLSTLAVKAWVFFEGTGTTSEDEQITLRGGLTIDSLDADINGAALGSATGSFHATAITPTMNLRVSGHAAGSAAGGFVAPDDPTTMQVAGTATFTLEGFALDTSVDTAGSEAAPAENALVPTQEDWPEELLTRLLELLESRSTDDAP